RIGPVRRPRPGAPPMFHRRERPDAAWSPAAGGDRGDAGRAGDRGLPRHRVGRTHPPRAGALPAPVPRLPPDLLTPDEARAAPITVQDRGDRFRIAVRSAATMLEDPARDCAARARQAAVVAATTLQAQRIALGPPDGTIERGLVIELPGAAGEPLWSVGAEFR